MKILRKVIAAGILILFLASFGEAPQTFEILHKTWFNVLAAGDLGKLFAQARTPRAGEWVLPPVVLAGISLLRDNRVAAYRCSPIFEQEYIENKARLIEGAYPIRYDENAQYLLRLEQESSDRNCSNVSRGEGVVLVYCP
jgi:hypothetical protein